MQGGWQQTCLSHSKRGTFRVSNWVCGFGAPSFCLGVPVAPFLGEGSPTKIDYRRKKNGTLILTSLLEDLVVVEKEAQRETAHLRGLLF